MKNFLVFINLHNNTLAIVTKFVVLDARGTVDARSPVNVTVSDIQHAAYIKQTMENSEWQRIA